MSWRDLGVSREEIDAARRIFAKKARFLLDENVDSEAAAFLRQKGYNVRRSAEAGLAGHPDENVLALAFREDRMLLTHDRDYLNDKRFPPHRNPGVVILPGANGDTKALVVGLLDLLAIVAPFRDLYRSAKVEIGADRIVRMRMRHHDTGRMTTTRYQLSAMQPPQEWIEEEPPPSS